MNNLAYLSSSEPSFDELYVDFGVTRNRKIKSDNRFGGKESAVTLKDFAGTLDISFSVFDSSLPSYVCLNGKDIVRVVPKQRISPAFRVQVIQKWEGVVYKVDWEANEFTAVICDKTNPENPREEVVLNIDEISQDDLGLLSEGSTFYWSIGHQYKGATKSKLSTINFSRLKPFSKKQIEAARQKAKETVSLFEEFIARSL